MQCEPLPRRRTGTLYQCQDLPYHLIDPRVPELTRQFGDSRLEIIDCGRLE